MLEAHNRDKMSKMPHAFHRLLLTGVAGGLGFGLRRCLPAHCDIVCLSEVAEPGQAEACEEPRPADWADAGAVPAPMDRVDAPLHMDDVSIQQACEAILPANTVCGATTNPQSNWGNTPSAPIGDAPRSISASRVAEIDGETPPRDPANQSVIDQGGAFVRQEPGK